MSEGRLVIHRILLTDFKTYVGTVEVGPFHEGFNGIIGANGSGKSNIVDALAFVFGRRAAQLRHRNQAHLIHTSDNYAPSSARVEVEFRWVPAAVVTSTVEFVRVAREVHCTEGSTYYVNGVVSSFGKMCSFMRGYGIDVTDSRFLVLQGEIESTCQLPPKAQVEGGPGLLELLEDLFGTAEYTTQLAALDNSLTDLKQALSSAQQGLAQSKGSLKILGKQYDEIIAHLHARRSLLTIRALLAAKRELQQETRDAELAEALAQRVDELEALRGTLTELLTNVADQEAAYSSGERELAALVEARAARTQAMNALDCQAESLQATVQLYQAELTATERTQQELERALAKLIQEQSELETLEEQRVTETPRLTAREAEYETQLKACREAMIAEKVRLNELTDKFKHKLDLYHSDLAAAKGQLAGLTSRKQMLLNERDLVASRKHSVTTELASLTERCSSIIAEVSDLAAQTKARREEVAHVETQLRELAAQKTALLREQEDLSARLRSGSCSKHVIANRILYTALSKEFESVGSPLYKCGFFLLDHLEVDLAAYGTALTTAGLNSEFVITNDFESSHAIVEFVRKNRLGRVLCLVKANQLKKAAQLRQVYESKNSCGVFDQFKERGRFLFELFENADSEIHELVLAKLGLTFFCEHPFSATKSEFKRASERMRVVYRSGEIIERNGSISGGAANNYLAERRAKQCLSAEEYQATQKQLDSRREQLDNIGERANVLKRRLQHLQRNIIAELQNSFDAKVAEGQFIDDKIRDCKALAASLANSESPTHDAALTTQLQELETEISKCSEKVRELEQLIKESETEIRAAQRNIDLAATQQYQATKSELDECRKQLARFREIETNFTVLVNKIRAKTTHITQDKLPAVVEKIENRRADIKHLDAEINRLFEEKESLRREILELPTSASLETALKEMHTQLAETRCKINQIELNIATAELKVKRLEEQRNAVTIEIKKLEAEIAQYESDYKLIPDEQLQDVPQEQLEKLIGLVPELAPTQASAAEFQNFSCVRNKEFVKSLDYEALNLALTTTEQRVNESDSVDYQILQEYAQKRLALLEALEIFEKRAAELNSVTAERNRVHTTRLSAFCTAFHEFSQQLKHNYRLLTRSGDAELEFVDSDPFSSGIKLTLRPPNKNWRTIENVSGGERTMCALVFILTMNLRKPFPFYFFDEIDAALDSSNVTTIATFLLYKMAAETQIFMITQRHEAFQYCNRLFGVVRKMHRGTIYHVDLPQYQLTSKTKHSSSKRALLMGDDSA